MTLAAATRRWRDKVDFIVLVADDDATRPPAAGSGTYAIGRDAGSQAARAFKISGMPTLVFVTASGEILDRRSGLTDSPTVERRIRALIAEGPART